MQSYRIFAVRSQYSYAVNKKLGINMLVPSLQSRFLQRCFAFQSLASQLDVAHLFSNPCSSFSSLCYSSQAIHYHGHRLIDSPGNKDVVSSPRSFYKLRVDNLPKNATNQMLREHFSQFGTLVSVKVSCNEETDGSHNIGYVVFADKKASDKAVDSDLNVISNKAVRVSRLPKVQFVVKGLSLSTTEESLYAYFSQFGKISRVTIQFDAHKGLNYAYVSFTNEDEVDQGLTSRTHVIDGNELYVAFRSSAALVLSLEHLSSSTTADSLAAYFSRFGKSISAQVKSHQLSEQYSRLGFVYFSSTQQLEAAMCSRTHVIDGKEVILKRLVPFRLLVHNITSELSDDSIMEFFKQFGTIENCGIRNYESMGKRRRVFRIDFSSKKELNKALDARPHIIDGILVSSISKSKLDFRAVDIIFVGGLSRVTTKDVLRNVFEKFGSVVDCNMAVDKKTGKSKKYAFVKFAHAFQAEKAILARALVIDGVNVDVSPCYGYSGTLSSENNQEKEEEPRYGQSEYG